MDNMPNTTPSTNSGVSNPPDGGAVTNVASAFDSNGNTTIPEASAPNSPPPAGSVQQPQPSATGVQNTPPNTQAQQGQPQQPQQGIKQPNAKPPIPAQPPVAQVPPAVRKAGIFHDIAETLAGGPRYQYTVDAYGNMQKQKVPVSNGHLALAIALEAIQGGLTGASQQGPNSAARGGAMAFEQGAQRVQQQDQQARQQATEDYARRAQVLETNMRTYMTARQLGKMDYDSNNDVVGQWSDTLKNLQENAPGYIEGPVSYNDLSKYHVTLDNAIPAMTVPRLDPATGKQSVDSRGIPQWDMSYYIVKPGVKLSNLFTKDDLDQAKKYGFAWGNNDALIDTPMSLRLYMNLKSQLTQLSVADKMFQNEFDKYDKNKAGNSYKLNNDVDLKNNKYDDAISTAANKYGVNPNFIKGIISEESGGNLNATSPTGVKGIMQTTLETGSKYGLTGDADRLDPNKSIDAGSHYFRDLLTKYHDPKLALAAYYSGDGAIKDGEIIGTDQHSVKDTNRYVNDILKKTGYENTGQAESQNPDRMSMADYITKNPQSRPAFAKFFNAVNSPNNAGESGLYGPALAQLNKTDPQSAGQVAAFLNQGDPNFIKNHDQEIMLNTQEAKAHIQTVEQEERAKNKADLDAQAQQKKQSMLDSLENAKLPDNILSSDPNVVVSSLKQQGVTLPADIIKDAIGVANYDIDPNDFANRNWFKDNTFTRGQVDAVVKQFNPDWNEGYYGNLKKYTDPNGKTVQTLNAAAGAANHLNDLLQVAKEVNSNGNGSGQFPLLNKLKNEYNLQTGGTAFVQLSALTNAINGELGRTLAGGWAPDKEQTQALIKSMTPANSLNQINALAKTYTDVMYGKTKPLDETYSELKNGQHMKNIPPSLTSLYQKYGEDTPWAPKQQQQAQQPNQPNPNEKPVIVNGQTIGYTIDGKTLSRLGQ